MRKQRRTTPDGVSLTNDVSGGVDRCSDALIEKNFLQDISPGGLSDHSIEKFVPNMSFNTHDRSGQTCRGETLLIELGLLLVEQLSEHVAQREKTRGRRDIDQKVFVTTKERRDHRRPSKAEI